MNILIVAKYNKSDGAYMDDMIILSQLTDHFKNRGYLVEHYTDIIKIKYDDSDINILKKHCKIFQIIITRNLSLDVLLKTSYAKLLVFY